MLSFTGLGHPPRRLILQGSVVGLMGVLATCCSATDSPAGRPDTSSGSAVRGARPPAGSLGLNVSTLASIYSEIPFVDVFKETQPWIFAKKAGPYGAPVSGNSSVTQDGWVRTLAPDEQASACAFQDGAGHYPAGVYTLLYDGEGDLGVRGPVRVISKRIGQIKVDVSAVKGAHGICIIESRTSLTNPIRNIRFIMPGFEKTYLTDAFYPPFLNEFRPFSVVRLLDWSRVNRSEVVNWSDRRPMTYATQAKSTAPGHAPPTPPVADNDVALEYQIDFANRIGINPWFLTPIKASDDYIRHMAQLVHQRLRPDLHPMIELSNEVWNGYFSQYQYAKDMGEKLNLDPLAAPGKSIANLYWYSLRAGQMFDIWNEVYGQDARKISHIVSGQQSWPREAEIILGYGNLYRKVDVLAEGGYVHPYNFYRSRDAASLEAIANLSVDQVIEQITANIENTASQWSAEKAIADRYGVGLVVYEGGFDFDVSMLRTPYSESIAKLFATVTRDPRMGRLYRQLLSQMDATGVILFNHYNDVGGPGVHGSWGALEYQEQDPETSPKYMALVDYATRHSVRWPP